MRHYRPIQAVWTFCLALCAAPVADVAAAAGFDDHVFVTTSPPGGPGSTASVAIDPPWSASTGLQPVAEFTVVRHFFGKHYVVNRPTGLIQVIDPETFDVIAQYSVGADSSPHDILVVDANKAYVSRHDRCELLAVHPFTGTTLASIDLCFLADADGLPEMSMMARDGSRLFLQIQRLDRNADETPVLPSYLAVIDIATDQVLDVDPQQPGLQAIELSGPKPSHKMHVDRTQGRLYVSEPGLTFDPVEGGIEAVDLDTLQALGYVTSESQLFVLDLGAFVMVSPVKGYVWTYTDFAALSHLTPFSRVDGSPGTTMHNSGGIVHGIVHDPPTSRVFVADVGGLHVIDAVTGTRLTNELIGTGSTPVDLVVARDHTPGEATDLVVETRDPTTGAMTVAYRPGCNAPDHTLVFGPLAGVGSYAYSGQVCGIGGSGRHDGFSPGAGSYFFLVVANDGNAFEGSYGLTSTMEERPEDLGDPVCAFNRDLSRRCDP